MTTTTSQRQSLLAVTALFVSMMLLRLPQESAAFVGVPSWMISSSSSSPSSSSRCMAKRRGNLGKVVPDGVIAAPAVNRKTKASRKQTSPLRRQTAADGNISPDLAKWMATQPPANENSSSSADAAADAVESSLWQQPVKDDDTTGSDYVAPAFVSFTKKSSSSRRERQGERMAAEQARQQQIQAHIQQLEQVLGLSTTSTSDDTTTKKSASSLTDIIAPIRQLILCGDRSSSLQQLLLFSKQQQRLDYRLAWVGSDAAICHVGTGLHKVPLARLQEVFLSFNDSRGGRVTWQEVIRILGPFPNVKNTLAGTAQSANSNSIMTTRMNRNSNSNNKKQQKDSDDTADTDTTNNDTTTDVVGSDWRITWDSMVDGTGKEILAGTAANQRIVDLHVYLADPAVLIAAVPSPAGPTTTNTNPMNDEGAQLMVFLREDDLNGKLESLRVA